MAVLLIFNVVEHERYVLLKLALDTKRVEGLYYPIHCNWFSNFCPLAFGISSSHKGCQNSWVLSDYRCMKHCFSCGQLLASSYAAILHNMYQECIVFPILSVETVSVVLACEDLFASLLRTEATGHCLFQWV